MEVLLKLSQMAINGAPRWAIETIHHLEIIIVVVEKEAPFTLRGQIMALLKTQGVGLRDVSNEGLGHERTLPTDVFLTTKMTSLIE